MIIVSNNGIITYKHPTVKQFVIAHKLDNLFCESWNKKGVTKIYSACYRLQLKNILCLNSIIVVSFGSG